MNPIIVMLQHHHTEKWCVDYVIDKPDEIREANTFMGMPRETRYQQAILRHTNLLRAGHPIMELHEVIPPIPFNASAVDAFNQVTERLRQPEHGGHFFHFEGFDTKCLGQWKVPPLHPERPTARQLRNRIR